MPNTPKLPNPSTMRSKDLDRYNALALKMADFTQLASIYWAFKTAQHAYLATARMPRVKEGCADYFVVVRDMYRAGQLAYEAGEEMLSRPRPADEREAGDWLSVIVEHLNYAGEASVFFETQTIDAAIARARADRAKGRAGR